MKRLLVPVLVALAWPPIVISAKSYTAGIAEIQWPKMIKLIENAMRFSQMNDLDAACDKIRQYNTLLKMNFEGLQEIMPDMDWFERRKKGLSIQEMICSKR